MIASFGIALFGVLLGAMAAYIGEHGSAARASRQPAIETPLRDAPFIDMAAEERDKIVQLLLAGAELERLPVPQDGMQPKARPKIIIVFDDMGLDHAAFERALALPGPLTYSFLPYAQGVDGLARKAREQGAEIMLHLPMEPEGGADPGPHALRLDMTGATFIETLEWNLARFDGYVGVNNHMGSKLTADTAAMKTVLAYLKERGIFYLDSVTTGETVMRKANAAVGADAFSRDVFLDAQAGDRAFVRRQLDLVERIARETGYAVAICHPRAETIDVLGPWLATAPSRGFELAPASSLLSIAHDRKMQQIMAMAPGLRG